jgi:mannitol-1-phosphate 5-dehydrogenase
MHNEKERHVPLTENRTFVGFGFGAIQTGLFIFEALRSGKFERVVVAEVVPEIVRAVRDNGGRYHLNIAQADRIESVEVGPIEMLDPAVDKDRAALIAALSTSDEAATAVPSVDFYGGDSPSSISALLAEGLARRNDTREPLVVYAAENHNDAAAILRARVVEKANDQTIVSRGCFVDTVIGKMSGVIAEPDEVAERGLTSLAPTVPRALLVEAFNRILVSRPRAADGHIVPRGIDVFVEKDDLLPFEEAKLFGHNAAHALAAYLGALSGVERMDELRDVDGAADFVRAAFLEESGAALIRKHDGVDALFTDEGFEEYVDDLMTRMLNPFLGDLVERVTRDPRRKLGWNDRLIGTLRLCDSQDIAPRRFARGVAAAILSLDPSGDGDSSDVLPVLRSIWDSDGIDAGRQLSERLTRLFATVTLQVEGIRGAPPERLFA